jgi:hypothetical protein
MLTPASFFWMRAPDVEKNHRQGSAYAEPRNDIEKSVDSNPM